MDQNTLHTHHKILCASVRSDQTALNDVVQRLYDYSLGRSDFEMINEKAVFHRFGVL